LKNPKVYGKISASNIAKDHTLAVFLLLPHASAFFFEVPAVLYLRVWFFMQLFSGTLALASPAHVGGIAWWAHVGGFVAGLLLCILFARRHAVRRMQPDEYGVEWAWQPHRR
jgi:membrane associated rhomboid family serine protease